MRVGLGYDVHKLGADRRLVIGGIEIPFDKGLIGHSDADVLVHAICDALLGAAGIGTKFPDSDPKYKNIYSIHLLSETQKMVLAKGYRLKNIDSVIFAEAPKFAPYYREMRDIISKTLEVNQSAVNIKSTTTEGLGYIGKGDGIAAMCIALID